jgi:beta-aspartyl-peptidase (threonine type)
MHRLLAVAVLFLLMASTQGCTAGPSTTPSWAIVVHGGAGTIDRDAPAAERRAYVHSMTAALTAGRDVLASGGSSLDAVEKVVRILEDDPLFNAGKGAVYTYDGTHELDASIMDGSNLRCGAVAGVKTVRNPISLARQVMEHSPHVLLAGDGAEKFADYVHAERVDNAFFDTPRRREQWQNRRAEIDKQASATPRPPMDPRLTYGTVGAVALDTRGRLAAATSTGGLTCKRWGRIGDTPIIGAGTYADSHAAVSCTGTGEEFIRNGVARQIALLVEHGKSAGAAADLVVNHRLKPDDGGVIVLSQSGEVAMVFNSDGMFRAVANSGGRMEIGIWEDMKPIKEIEW